MEKLLTRKEAAGLLGVSITTLDAARNEGLVSFVQYVENGCVYFTEAGLQEYIARATHKAKPKEINTSYRIISSKKTGRTNTYRHPSPQDAMAMGHLCSRSALQMRSELQDAKTTGTICSRGFLIPGSLVN